MSAPDYDQFSEDHQCLLIVVKPIGPQMNQNLFNSIYENLIQLNELKITNSKIVGFERIIRIRYKRSYSIEENDWGDFQAHRKLIGLITVARSFNENEIESISELHKTIHDTYNNTLFDSKCFIIKSSDTPETNVQATEVETKLENHDGVIPDEYNSEPNGSGECKIEEKSYCCRNSDSDPLLDFDICDQLYISSDHTCFTSRVNRSSSSSSLSSQNSQSRVTSPTDKSSKNNLEEAMNYSLPPITDGELNLNHSRSRTHSRNKSLDSRLLSITEPSNNDKLKKSDNSIENNLINSHKRAHSSSTTLLSSTPQNSCDYPNLYSSANEFINYESDDHCCELIKMKTKEFLNRLFWVLESKRLDKTRKKKDKIPLLMAPCEKKDLIGVEPRDFKRKCLGRMQKHIADISLMAGLPQESLLNYKSAIDCLKETKDKLWLASAYEGLCAASLVLLYPQRWHYIHDLRYRFSYSKGVVYDLLNRKDYENARTEVGQAMKMIAIENSQADPEITSNKNLMKHILTGDEFYNKYKEAASNYALYRGAAIIEFECSFKAAKTLTFFRRYLNASDFIQNAVCISLNNSIEEQIERLLRISNLYEMIGFYRKAAFFKRFAALKTVCPTKKIDWEKCYFLLLPALYGYGLNLDPTEYDKRLENGNLNWSSIHVELLQEIIKTSLKMENETLAIRHISFILQCLFAHITPIQRKEFAKKLSSLASKCGEGSPVPLKLTNGATIPSVNFTKFPTVVYFKVEPLKPYLELYKLRHKSMKDEDESDQKDSGPFIYTPIQLNQNSQKVLDKRNPNSITKMKFCWAEGNIGCVSLSLHNYLPIELNISSIVMMTDGVAFEPKHDTALKIPPYSSSYKNITLTGIPRSSGTLDILGYKIHTLGIKSDCKLKDLPNAKKLKLPSKFTIEVVPRMPLMCAQCLMADDLNEEICSSKNIVSYKDRFPDCYIANSNFISLFEGQNKSYKIKLTNISANNDELIDLINVRVIHSKGTSANLQNLVNVEWDMETINNLLPFGQNLSVEFDIHLTVKGDFILPENTNKTNGKHKMFSTMPQNDIQPKKLQVLGSKKLANFINELQSRKSSQDFSLLNSNQLNNKDTDESDYSVELSQSKIVELCLQFEYSGGPGLNSGYCRRINIYFAIEIKPSILITHWDVIQAEQIDECYMVFDTLNATEQEINLIYSPNKEMLIEPKEKCRIPVPIKRCPLNLSDLEQENQSLDEFNCYNPNMTHGQKTMKSLKSVDFLTHIFPTEQKLEAILTQCRFHLLKQISLKWTIPNTDTDGIVIVEKVPYSRELLKSLLIPPIQSEITLNGIVFRSSYGEANLKLREQLCIAIQLFNSSDATLHNLRLYLVYYQDFQNPILTKTLNDNIRTKVIVNGCESLCIKELQTKETYLHECGLIFLYSGIYKLDICCLPEERYEHLIKENGLSSLIDIIDPNDQTNSNNNNTNFNTQHHSLFKRLHTFEINVDE